MQIQTLRTIEIRSIRMHILTIEKGSLTIQMQILTIQKGFEAFECKFKRDSDCKFEPFKRDSKHSNANSNHSNEIRSIQTQILTVRKGFEAFECKFEPTVRDSKHSNAISNQSKGIRTIRIQIRII